jgi:hypothetical protein
VIGDSQTWGLTGTSPKFINALGMECDSRYIPTFTGGVTPIGTWLAGVANVGGYVAIGSASEAAREPRMVSVNGTAALAVGGGRLIGILSAPKGPGMLWLSWAINDISVKSHGSDGIAKKRPHAIQVDLHGGAVVDNPRNDAATMTLKVIVGVDRVHNRQIPRQELELLQALGG